MLPPRYTLTYTKTSIRPTEVRDDERLLRTNKQATKATMAVAMVELQ